MGYIGPNKEIVQIPAPIEVPRIATPFTHPAVQPEPERVPVRIGVR